MIGQPYYVELVKEAAEAEEISLTQELIIRKNRHIPIKRSWIWWQDRSQDPGSWRL